MRPLDEYPHCEPSRCAACGAEVVWVRGASGVAIAVNAEPDPDGAIVIITGLVQPPLGGLTELIFGGYPRYTNHVRTCPELDASLLERSDTPVSTKPHPHEVKNCNCGASMFFAPSAKGGDKKIPIQELPSPTGNIFLNEKHEAVYVSQANPAPAGAPLYTSHFVDCPHASQFRSKK